MAQIPGLIKANLEGERGSRGGGNAQPSDRLPKTRAARRHAIHALHAATDVYTWKLLRRDLQLSRADTERIMRELVDGILDQAGTGTGRRRRSSRST